MKKPTFPTNDLAAEAPTRTPRRVFPLLGMLAVGFLIGFFMGSAIEGGEKYPIAFYFDAQGKYVKGVNLTDKHIDMGPIQLGPTGR